MNTLVKSKNIRAKSVKVSSLSLHIYLADGRKMSVPLSWFPRLKNALPSQRNHVQIICQGTGLHWPKLDEDISVTKLVTGHCEE